MIKKILFSLLDTLFVGLFFFFISYAFFEYTMDSKNGAMITGFCTTVLFCIAYYSLRKLSRNKSEEKAFLKDSQKKLALCFTLMPFAEFKQAMLILFQREGYQYCMIQGNIILLKNGRMFPLLLDNSAKGLELDSFLHFLQALSNQQHHEVYIFSVNPLDAMVEQLLQNIQIKANMFPIADIYALYEKHDLPLPKNALLKEFVPERKFKRIKDFKNSPHAVGFAFKYGALLLIWSFFTGWKGYYLVFSLLLFAFGLYAVLNKRRLQSRKIF